ncbi:hypothetical protein CLV35_3005 [Motilibacter peucedani]|uniref:Putative membrane protein insertion efficiency factor n=1 Tax=Motilibacter peucedani TaxID=598650 RepID=A0A420XNA3_9ACTN|nr:membrane protein insertion efficiency factor YidD [Motilibacter peucedani]RKS72756.1 hypothetical protein CLV35_3005 [Motilibacter peucedani]
MVWVNWGGRRPPRGYGSYGPFGGYGRGGYGRGGGYYGRGGGGCLRDVFLLETGCCLAEMLGCGPQLLLVAPAAVSLLRAPAARGTGGTSRAERLIRLYQSRISTRRERPCCRMTPSCSEFAIEALHTHGTLHGVRLTAGRILRCRPGGTSGYDPVPPARA